MKRVLFITLAALISAQESKEAEKLFRKMEEKILNAKSMRITFTSSLNKVTLKGEMWCVAPDQIRIDGTGTVEGLAETMKGSTICDGRKVAVTLEEGRWNRFDAPPKYGRFVRTGFVRHGIFDAQNGAGSDFDSKKDPDKYFSAAGFKLGSEEKVNGRPARQVIYILGRGSWEEACIVWIDAESHLPVKRSYTMEAGRINESYAVTIDEKIDPAKFELPK